MQNKYSESLTYKYQKDSNITKFADKRFLHGRVVSGILSMMFLPFTPFTHRGLNVTKSIVFNKKKKMLIVNCVKYYPFGVCKKHIIEHKYDEIGVKYYQCTHHMSILKIYIPGLRTYHLVIKNMMFNSDSFLRQLGVFHHISDDNNIMRLLTFNPPRRPPPKLPK